MTTIPLSEGEGRADARGADGPELLPCPFCGSGAVTCEGDGMWYASCDSCSCSVGEAYDASAMPDHRFHSEDDAIAAWNRRTSPAPAKPSGPHPTKQGE